MRSVTERITAAYLTQTESVYSPHWDNPAACSKNPPLWDYLSSDTESTKQRHMRHSQAITICNTVCKVKTECHQALLVEKVKFYTARSGKNYRAHGPEGVWAGKLYGARKPNSTTPLPAATGRAGAKRPDNCVGCHSTLVSRMVNRADMQPGEVKHHGQGYCQSCYSAAKRAERRNNMETEETNV